MGTLASAGIGSGIDIGNLVASLVDAERVPATKRYDANEADLQAKVSAFGTLKSSLSAFKDSLSTLKFSSSFNSRTATSTDDTAITATASSIATAGTYAMSVTSLAQAHSISSLDFTNTTDLVGEGTLSFDFGFSDAGIPSFTANTSKSTKTVTISADNNTVSGVRDAVNAANIGVTASIVNTGSAFKLVFTSNETGKENGLKITVADSSDASNTDNVGLSQLAYDAVGGAVNMTENLAAKDANFTINGLTMSSATNSVGSAISGMTFNLIAVTASTNITVANDNSAVTKSVTDFTTKFNELADTMNLLADYNFKDQKGGVLLGDSVIRGVESKIRRLLSGSVTDAQGNIASLATIGVKTGSDGKLTLDTKVLDAAIKNDSTLLSRLFSAQATTSDAQVNYVTSTKDTQTGDYSVDISAMASRGSLTGSALTLPVDLSALSPSITLSVDGVSSGAISLTAQSYTTGADLAAEIQAKVNASNALKDKGVSMVASYDATNGTLSLLSALYGSQSTLDITALTDLSLSGLTVATGNAGVDVAGTIGGSEGLGLGTLLTATGDAKGMVLDISAGSTGNRGNASFNRGIADQLDSLLTDYLAKDNLIDARVNGLNSNISRITAQRAKLATKLADLETRLFKTFNAMDSIVAKLKSTGNYLTSQLANLPGVVKQKN